MRGRPTVSNGVAAAALAGAAMTAAASPAEAQTIIVPCSTPALINAINTANGFSAATVRLSPNCVYNLTTPTTPTEGVPQITGNVTIIGGPNTTIRRDPTVAALFRIFRVVTGARLSIAGVFILNGNINFQGGGILNAGTLVLNRVTMSGNTGSDGGAVSNSGNPMLGAVTATISRSVFSANTATNLGGGAIVNVTGTLNLIKSFVNGNSAPAGAGLNNQPQAVTNIAQSTFSANSATGAGGGIEVVGGTVRLTRTLVERNRAGGTGGGIDRPNGTVTLMNSLVRNNTPNNCDPPNTIPGCVG